MRLRRKSRVHCAGCANLFYLGGETHPMCVATAEFIGGPIRDKVEVTGVVSAERRNAHNNCPYRKGVSRRAYNIKRWLLWRLNDGNTEGQVTEKRIEEYPVDEEYSIKRKLEEESVVDEQDEEILFTGEEGEDILGDGGVGDNDESGTSGEGGGEDVQDT